VADKIANGFQLLFLAGDPPHPEREIGARKSGNANHRIAQGKVLDDVFANDGGGRCGEGGDRGAAERLDRTSQAEIVRPEIMTPLRQAMRLVDGETGHPLASKEIQKAGGPETLGGDIEQSAVARADHRKRFPPFLLVLEAVKNRDRKPFRLQHIDLILHQRDQGRHHDRQALREERGQLVAERLPPSGRQDGQDIPPVHHIPDDLLLRTAKVAETEKTFQLVC